MMDYWLMAPSQRGSGAFHLYFLDKRPKHTTTCTARIGCRAGVIRQLDVKPSAVSTRLAAAQRMLRQQPGKCCKVCLETATRIVKRALE